MFDRYQICEAYYLFLMHNHEGQGSRKYARLSKLLTYFKPSPLLCLSNCSVEAFIAYNELVKRNNAAQDS